jgi:putative transposase
MTNMGRTARLVVPGFPHHVTQRGARKQPTFFRTDDYRIYVSLMAQAMQRADAEIWAYCLMPNHVHLVVVPRNKNSLADLFRHAHRTYTLRVNSREGWQGHLWQERFHSFVMDEPHLLAAVRYVELNPVRAGLCGHPESWRWSSYHAHLAGTDDKLVSVAPMLKRVTDWKKYLSVDDSIETLDALRSHTRTGRPVGNDAFLSELERVSGRDLSWVDPDRKVPE